MKAKTLIFPGIMLGLVGAFAAVSVPGETMTASRMDISCRTPDGDALKYEGYKSDFYGTKSTRGNFSGQMTLLTDDREIATYAVSSCAIKYGTPEKISNARFYKGAVLKP